jgi:hypothetical protein
MDQVHSTCQRSCHFGPPTSDLEKLYGSSHVVLNKAINAPRRDTFNIFTAASGFEENGAISAGNGLLFAADVVNLIMPGTFTSKNSMQLYYIYASHFQFA